jgi:hypothetical protein
MAETAPSNKPLPPSVVRRTVTTIATLIVVAGIPACVMALFIPSCWDEKTQSMSPDSQRIARGVAHYCAGPLAPNLNVTQFLEIGTVGTDRKVRIFEGSSGAPAAIHWVDNSQLSLEIGTKLTITLGLHDADGVRITYHVPEKLMSPLEAENSERQAEYRHQAGDLKEGDYETLKEMNQSFRRWEEGFIRWASENAIIDSK